MTIDVIVVIADFRFRIAELKSGSSVIRVRPLTRRWGKGKVQVGRPPLYEGQGVVESFRPQIGNRQLAILNGCHRIGLTDARSGDGLLVQKPLNLALSRKLVEGSA